MSEHRRHHPEKGDQQHASGGMGARGVTRPMAEQQVKQQHNDHEQMGPEQRQHMLVMHHHQTLWVYWTIVALGVWMILAPLTFSYSVGTVEPSGGRSVWLSLPQRVAAMTWSDIISGMLLVVFGWRSLRPGRPVSRWICAGVGAWLNLAPLIFWAPTAAAYLNDSLVGTLVIALAVLIPGMPNMIMYMQMGPPTPPGWSYNPSSWPQRWIMIATGFAGWLVSRYLGAFQLGFLEQVWDPFFGEGSRMVLNSDMSHMWPISDGAFGTFAYTLEFLMGWMGSPSRWRTMPWMVTFFGILVIPLGLVHIFLVISQPVLVGYWCTFCLVAAAIMLPMIPLEVDEVIAMGQHVLQARRRGEPFWRVFWKGGAPEGSTPDQRSPELAALPERPGAVLRAAFWGMSFPVSLIVATGLGAWLMAAPAIFGLSGLVSDLHHLGGALIVVASVIAMGEPVRALRFLNIPLGLAIAVLPWTIAGSTLPGSINGLVAGALVVALSIARGPKYETYGSWDRLVV